VRGGPNSETVKLCYLVVIDERHIAQESPGIVGICMRR
jgi:hypothetical protein